MSVGAGNKPKMPETERIVRIFHESWDLRDPERGAAVIAEDCRFEDVARGELLSGREGYRRDYHLCCVADSQNVEATSTSQTWPITTLIGLRINALVIRVTQ